MITPRQTLALATTLLALGIMSGCATMNADECRNADWRIVGYEDGLQGAGGDRIGQHREACAKHSVTPDLEAYQSGRTIGLKEFCQPLTGFHLGSAGRNYNGVCPDNLETDFLAAYRDGRELYRYQGRVNTIESTIRSRHSEIETIKQTLTENEALIISGDTSKEDRVLLLKEMWDLAKHQGELEEEIKNLEIERASRIQELEDYRAQVQDLY